MNAVFISYRRADSADVTGRIFDHLKQEFGADVLFKDVDSIPFGGDFVDIIHSAIDQCEVILVIIGKDWLDLRGQDGGRRIDDPGDYVHTEILAALKIDKPLIPVLVEEAVMPKPQDLPSALRSLALKNATKVRADPDFSTDIQRLAESLTPYVARQQPFFKRLWFRRTIIAVAIACAFLAASYVYKQFNPQPCFFRIFDQSTHDPIKRSFKIYDPDHGNIEYTRVGEDFKLPDGYTLQPEKLRFECAGYEVKPELGCWGESNPEQLKDRNLLCFSLKRAEGYYGQICSQLPPVPMSDAEIIASRQENRIEPADVVILVDNDTSFRPDVLFRPLFAENEEELRWQGSGCFPIRGEELQNSKSSRHELVFDLPEAVGAIYLSFESDDHPELIYHGAFYKNKFMKISILQRNSPSGKVSFDSSSD